MNYTAVVFKICYSERKAATFTPTSEHLWVVCSLSVPTGTEAFPCRCSLLPTSSRRHAEIQIQADYAVQKKRKKEKFHLQTKYLHHLLKKDGSKQTRATAPGWINTKRLKCTAEVCRPYSTLGRGERGGGCHWGNSFRWKLVLCASQLAKYT